MPSVYTSEDENDPDIGNIVCSIGSAKVVVPGEISVVIDNSSTPRTVTATHTKGDAGQIQQY